MSLQRISQLEHELGLQMPCSDPECWVCTGPGKVLRAAWDAEVNWRMAATSLRLVGKQ